MCALLRGVPDSYLRYPAACLQPAPFAWDEQARSLKKEYTEPPFVSASGVTFTLLCSGAGRQPVG